MPVGTGKGRGLPEWGCRGQAIGHGHRRIPSATLAADGEAGAIIVFDNPSPYCEVPKAPV